MKLLFANANGHMSSVLVNGIDFCAFQRQILYKERAERCERCTQVSMRVWQYHHESDPMSVLGVGRFDFVM